MFVPLPEHLKNSLLEIVSKHKVNEKFEPNQEEENIIKQLQSAGYLSNFKLDVIGNCNADYRYEDLNYLFLEQEYNKHMPKVAQTFINNSGQMGVGFDKAFVNVIQNNGISIQDLLPYIERIKQAIQEEIDPEDRETAINSIDIILSELESGNPNEKNVKSHFKLLSKIGGGIKVAS